MKTIDDINPKTWILLSMVGIGIFIQLLEYHKIDDEPIKTTQFDNYPFYNSALVSTASVYHGPVLTIK